MQKELKLKLTVDGPDTSKSADAFQRVGAAAKDAADQVNKLSKAQQDAAKWQQRTALPGGPQSGLPGTVGPGIAQTMALGGPTPRPAFPGQLVPDTNRFASAIHGYRFAPPGTSGTSAIHGYQTPTGNGVQQAIQGALNGFQASAALRDSETHNNQVSRIALDHQQRFAADDRNRRHQNDAKVHGGNGGAAALAAAHPLAAAALVLGTVVGLSEFGARLTVALQQLDSQFVSSRDKLMNTYKTVPIIGDLAGRLVGNVIDTAERLRNPDQAENVENLRYQVPRERAIVGGQLQRDTRLGDLQRERENAGARVAALQQYPTFAYQEQALSAVGGFGVQAAGAVRDPRLTAALEASQTGRRERDIADRIAGSAADEVRKQSRSYSAALQDADIAKKKFDRELRFSTHPGERPGIGTAGHVIDTFGSQNLDEARLEYERKLDRAIAERNQLENAALHSKEAQLALVQKTADVHRLETGELRAQKSILQDRYAQSRNTAIGIGNLDKISQMELLNSSKRFKQYGREGVTEPEFGTLHAFFGPQIDKQTEKANDANPIIQQILDQMGAQNHKEIGEQLKNISSKIDVKVQVDEVQAAKAFQKAIENANAKDLLGALVAQKFELEFQKLLAEQAAGNAQQK